MIQVGLDYLYLIVIKKILLLSQILLQDKSKFKHQHMSEKPQQLHRQH